MARMAGICIQSLLKVVNLGIGMSGIAMIVYSLWMLRVWLLQLDSSQTSIPWFIYTVLGLGIIISVITCSGHIAAETLNSWCLNMYICFIFLLLVLEVAITADVFLNHSWEEDFPKDTTGNMDRLKKFIKDNFNICKWIGLTIMALEGMSILLVMILKAIIRSYPARYLYDSDDEYLPNRVPLLRNYYLPPQSYSVDSGAISVRANNKGLENTREEVYF